MKKETIAIIIAIAITFFYLGFTLGEIMTIKAVVYIARDFIEIDYKTVHDALYRYQNHLYNSYHEIKVFPNITN